MSVDGGRPAWQSSPVHELPVHIPQERRNALRDEFMAQVRWWYSPFLHLLIPAVVGLGAIAVAAALVESPTVFDLLTIPLTFVFANASEWRIHRDMLHKRAWFAPILYTLHTPGHHRVFTTEDMAMRNPRELRLVLLPAYGILLLLVSISPLVALLWWLLSPNVGLLFLAVSAGYVLCYEWLHLAYHLPADHPVSRLGFIRRFARHHSLHHHPGLMQRWNMNVTFPIWDWVRRTSVDDVGAVRLLDRDGGAVSERPV